MKVGGIPSDEEINWVHMQIEYCITKYMNKKQTMHILDDELKIDPAFTRTVWEKLEKDNPEFFKAYYANLLVKDQIEKFNELIWRQVELVHQYQRIVIEMNNGPYSDISPGSTQQISTPNCAQSSLEFIQQPQQQQLNGFSDDGSSFPASLQVTSDWFDANRDFGVSPNMVS